MSTEHFTTEPLRVAINCELAPGAQAGGTQSVVSGLVRALGELGGEEEYLLICHPENRTWLEPLAGAQVRLVDRPQPPAPRPSTPARQWLRDKLRAASREPRRVWPEVPHSRGFYESLGAHVIHWPWQHFVVTALPAIFNPHDLLHLHFPQFFKPAEIVAREAIYPVACRLAHTVVVGSEWAQRDFISRYALDPARVQIIPWAPPTQAFTPLPGDAAAAVREKYALPSAFAFYPAVTWEHKNHLRLLAALAELRDRRGCLVRLICTGHRFEPHAEKIEAEVKRLRLEEQVRFLGAVSFAELRAIYQAAQFVFVPTLFEAASGPVFEAWQEGTPVACSTVTSLPQQAATAALLFDPWSVRAMADALERMATDAALREQLRTSGQCRLADFPWERTARAYRAAYRRAARRPLTVEEEELLAWDWMRDARKSEHTP